ncbi:MAG: NADH-quinone oxidoreductase subunit N [Lysobacteraceae bacterium]|nr:MAG: NADH-quinone oxidoreductase subunit N [Xanthomonadaceae bacterium]
MEFDILTLKPLLPELFVLTMACLILVADLYISEARRGIVHMMAMLTLVFVAILTMRSYGGAEQATVMVMNGTFVRDQMGDILKLAIYVLMAAVFVYAKHDLRHRKLFVGEYYVLALFGMLGMMVMISAASLLSMYLGLELLALSSYALVALERDSARASESAMKYFVLGAMASGALLYGMSMIYGATGSLDLLEISMAVRDLGSDDIVLAFGLAFLVVGVAFKFGAVPFHMWLPDVYHGAPTPVTLFLAAAPKLAAFAMAIRLFDLALGDMHIHWQGMLVFLAVLSLALGNIVAIAQTNLKRMLAYSTISHVGFMLLGILAGTPAGYAASMFYAIIYAIMAAGTFGMIILLSRQGVEAENLDHFKGLNKRSPWFAAVMMFLLASLAGVPPFVGFFAKLQVLSAVVDINLTWLAVYAVIMSVIGAFYYLRVIKLMYLDAPDTDEPINAPFDLKAVLTVNGLAQLLLTFLAGPIIAACGAAFGI